MTRRIGYALLLALILAAPAATAPTTASARSAAGAEGAEPAPDAAAARAVGKPGADELLGPDGELPSVHYRQDLEHATDAIEFEPGDRVTVPFTPRAWDSWEIDGKAPKPLPPGHATGRQMRDAAQGSTWSGAAPDAPGRRLGGEPGTDPDPEAGVDQDPGANPASAVLTGATVDPSALEPVAAPVGSNGLRREIFGFLPYWEVSDSSTVLDWRTLSTVAYFSVGCTSGGNLLKKDADGTTSTGWAGWTSAKMTSVINAAHQNQTRVVLTISCFAWSTGGAQTQAALLGSATARTNLAKQIAAAVRDRGADGANLDFEPIVAGYADEFTALVRSVRAQLNAVAPGYQLTFDTMGSIGNQPIAEATAPGGADAVFIMGYDYRGASASVAGSISPLTGPVYDLTDTIKAYTAKVSPSKVILGIPYYGRAWSTSSDALHSKNISGTQYGTSAVPLYADIVDIVAANGRRWDSVEQSPWTAYRKQTCTSTYGCVTAWRSLYYDDAVSLRLKYDLVNRSSLRGTGIWALGFDDARPELRTALADKFMADTTPPVVGIATLAERQRDEGFRVAWSSYDDSTVTSYDVQASSNGGPWTAWLTGTTLTSAIHLGAEAHTYAFRVRATDSHGNASAWYSASSLASLDAADDLAPGGFGVVLVGGLKMRSSASTSGSIMTTLAAGDALQVIGGPVTGEGYTWFQVAGPVRQWASVDAMQVGGWVAASGNGVTNLAPRRPVYATFVDAGIRGLTLAGGADRVLTPNGDGVQDALHLAWTNDLAFDSLTLHVYRKDGSLAGSINVPDTAVGPAGHSWDGRIGGVVVPEGAYVLQLSGLKSSTTYTAPSTAPVSADQVARYGVAVGPRAPTSVASFANTTASPTTFRTISFSLTFGGPVSGLTAGDLTKTGSATGCVLGAPAGSGASYTVTFTSCGPGTVGLTLKADSVVDAVGNLGPGGTATSNTVVIDRTAPVTGAPRIALRSGVSLQTSSAATGLFSELTWTSSDAGGAGVASFDVARSLDGGPFKVIASARIIANLQVALMPGHSYRFEVRGRDRAGNVGRWVAASTVRPYLMQYVRSAIVATGAWNTAATTNYSGGSTRFSLATGASASYAFTGRAIGFVTTFGPSRGFVKIYVDGTLAATIDTYAAADSYRRVAFTRAWSSAGSHTLRIVVVGTAGHPRVDLDALEVIR